MTQNKSQPLDENELLVRCQNIEGMTFSQLAEYTGTNYPELPILRKGWVGQTIEHALGATSGSQSRPDFYELGIELKTIPINHLHQPAESTFITTIPLLSIHKQTWLTSQCYAKLKRVLWVPIEDSEKIPFPYRRIGSGILWSPSLAEEKILEQDWLELTFMIGSGKLSEINATMGEFLQVRPKAANAKSLCYGLDEKGNKIQTLPRGFYLRSKFTKTIFT